MTMSLNKQSVLQMLLISGLLGGLTWPVFASAQLADDLTQMDAPAARKKAVDEQSKLMNQRVKEKLRPDDAKKYQAAIDQLQKQNGAEIAQSMEDSHAKKMAAMPAERRKIVENFRNYYDTQMKTIDADPGYNPLNAALDKLHAHLLGLDRGDNKVMSPQQKAYFEHREAQLRQKYTDPLQQEKNRRMLEEANAYMKANLDRQAEYGKNFNETSKVGGQTMAIPLPLSALQSNWLVQKMAKDEPATYTPRASALPPGTAEAVKAQLEDFSRQLRKNKNYIPKEPFGPGGRYSSVAVTKPDAAASAVSPTVNEGKLAPASAVKAADAEKNKAQEAPVRKPLGIPGL